MQNLTEYIFCGDDFTGASDTLATLARGGLNCRLFLDADALLNSPEMPKLDAVGIATATRSMPPGKIAATLEPFKKILARQKRGILHYKVCSTFDSSPDIGSIGAAIRTLHNFRQDSGVLILGGQPSLGRYCVFSNLFAAAPGGAVHRIDRHPTMAKHPVTPMHEADLVKLLATQGLTRISAFHRPEYREDLEHILKRATALWDEGATLLFDVEDSSDLEIIGGVIHDRLERHLIATGSSSVAEAYLCGRGLSVAGRAGRKPSVPEKPVFLLAGSRSPVTAAQVLNCRGIHQISLDPKKIQQNPELALQNCLSESLAQINGGRHVLAVVSGDMAYGLGRGEIAGFTAKLVSRVAFSGGISRIGIAGGDTSSLALQKLDADSLSYEADIEPGICLCHLHSAHNEAIDGMEIILKGGQMGSSGLFNKLIGPL
jgi:uncharacterized protein YgbK (DUF1537 family)